MDLCSPTTNPPSLATTELIYLWTFFFPIIIFILHKNWSCEIYPSLTYSLSIMPSRSIHVDKWQDFLLFYCSVIFHCIYTTFLYLFIHQWALQLRPCVYTGVMMGVQMLFWVSVFVTFFYLFFYMKSYMLCPCIVQRSWNCIYSSLWSKICLIRVMMSMMLHT